MPTKLQYPVFHFRGLNSHGDDHLRFGIFKLRPMHHHLEQYFSAHEVEFIPVRGIGAGPLKEQMRRACDFIGHHQLWQNPEMKIHLLGHSAGGLLARAAAHELGASERILTVTTIATPHRGAALAQQAERLPERRPLLHKAFRAVGYDVRKRLVTLNELRPHEVAAFTAQYPNLPSVNYASLIFSVPLKNLSWPLRLARSMDFERISDEHDGVVESSSQSWGRPLGEFDLDHLRQIGFELGLAPGQRRKTQRKFHEVCERLLNHWLSVEAIWRSAQIKD